ncbi:MAG: sigma-54-dependent Fis family transcriptional regulator [Ignavibacteria bacterium]|nr:sigma-54-dependent Fis family transcriptional regulator [Ignavibacteria bacterium]
MAKILIIDDEIVICKSCEKIFRRAGHETLYSTSGKQALKFIENDEFDVVFTDLKMVDIGGLEVLQFIRKKFPEIIVIVITGFATISSAVETMRGGAFDFLPKPFTPNELLAVLEKALEKRSLIQISKIPKIDASEEGFEGIIGKSPKAKIVFDLIRKVAQTDATILIIGESGTGKDLTARAIHNLSKRKDEKFFAIDISTLSTSLLESELFGYVKGSFTGATADKIGVFEVADKGTIFLDEIGNLSLETQARLLRVLQEKEIISVGSTTVKKVDVRLIFATNKDLKQLVDAGKFREDLFYRLNVFPIRLPSLRERREDIPELIIHFINKFGSEMNKSIPKIKPEALEVLLNYHWPGNIRELEHTIERLMILLEGNLIEPIHVSAALFKTETQISSIIPKSSEELKQLKKQIRESSVHEIEKVFITEALIRNNWNISKTARDVGMQRANLQALIRKYNIKKPI